jgi:YggT family protein
MIIARTLLFINWAVTAVIVAVVLLLVFRLIVIQADLNPFGWLARTTRRLADPITVPVAKSMARMGINPKYSPLVTILITILLGWFVLQLARSIANSLGGMLFGIQQGAPTLVIGHILYGLLSVYGLLIFMRIVFSWGMVSYRNRVMRFLVDTTEPLLGPLRRIIPPLGMIDISPLVAFFIVWLFQSAIAGTLLSGQSGIVMR